MDAHSFNAGGLIEGASWFDLLPYRIKGLWCRDAIVQKHTLTRTSCRFTAGVIENFFDVLLRS
jgi:hypothetical protein